MTAISMPGNEPANGERNFGLDVIRATAIILVLAAHTLHAIYPTPFTETIGTCAGVLGVELFFVLSGFLIGSIIIKIHNIEDITKLSAIKVFWIRRWFRTLPNYYFMLLMTIGYWWLMGGLPQFNAGRWFSFLVFLQNATLRKDFWFFGVSWSLCIEEWFYLLFPLALYFLQFFFPRKKQSLLVTLLLFCLLPLLVRCALLMVKDLDWDINFRKLLFSRLDGIGIGVFAAFIKYYQGQFWDKSKNQLGLLGLLLAIPLSIFFYNKASSIHLPIPGATGVFLKTLFFTLVSITIALLLPWLYSVKVARNNFLVKAVTFISLISYSLYLLHPIVIGFVCNILFTSNGSIIGKTIAIVAISLFISYLQYRFFERKITSLRNKFGQKKYAVSPD